MSTTLIDMVVSFSRIMFIRFPTSFIVNLFGSWEVVNSHSSLKPVSGLAYYLMRPHSFSQVLYDPIHAVISIILTVLIVSFFSIIGR